MSSRCPLPATSSAEIVVIRWRATPELSVSSRRSASRIDRQGAPQRVDWINGLLGRSIETIEAQFSCTLRLRIASALAAEAAKNDGKIFARNPSA
jgi:hypothetical protein